MAHVDTSGDVSAQLGLNHQSGDRARFIERAAAVGLNPEDIRVDEHGRMAFDPLAQPEEVPGYRADLVDKSADEIVEILKSEEDDRDGNDIAKLMTQYPGQDPNHHGGGSRSKGQRKKKPSGIECGDHIIATSYPDPRNKTLSVKVSLEAYDTMYGQIDGPGAMIEELAQTLIAGVPWFRVKAFFASEIRATQQPVAQSDAA